MHMNAHNLRTMLRFRPGQGLVLRDAEDGRIRVYRGNEWIATAGPGSLIGTKSEAFVLSKGDDDCEERGSWDFIAAVLSALQQEGDWPDTSEWTDWAAAI